MPVLVEAYEPCCVCPMSWSGLSRPSIVQQTPGVSCCASPQELPDKAILARWILGTGPRMTTWELFAASRQPAQVSFPLIAKIVAHSNELASNPLACAERRQKREKEAPLAKHVSVLIKHIEEGATRTVVFAASLCDSLLLRIEGASQFTTILAFN
jgi:hypothetical protein